MSADRAHNCHEVHIEQFIDERVDRLIDLCLVLMVGVLIDPGPLGLYKEIYNARAPCTWLVYVSHALENTDYLTHPLSFELFEVKANHLLVSVNVLIEL